MSNISFKTSSFTICALIAAGIAAILLPSAAQAEGKGVTKSEFTAAIVGKTISTTTSKGKPMSAVYKADGSGETAIEGIKKQPMKWTYNGTTLCTTIKAWSFTECNYVEIVSPEKANFVDAKTGKLNNVYSIK